MSGLHKMKPPGRVSRTVTGATRRLEGRTLLLGLIVTAVGIVCAWIAWSSINGVPFQDRYEIKVVVGPESPIIAEGDAVRIAGRLAGIVTVVEPDGENTEVSMALRPQYAPVGEDVRARIRVKSIIGLTYVELLPGDLDRPLAEGSTIPVERTSSGVELLDVVKLFDEKSRRTLRRAAFDVGTGLAGRGRDLNAAYSDLPAITEDGTAQLQAVTREPGALARFIAGASRVTRGLRGERDDDISASLRSGAAVVGTVAGRSSELGETIDLLRPVSDEVLLTAPVANPLLSDAAALGETLAPQVDSLGAALPRLNAVLALGDELRTETDRLTSEIRPLLRAAAPVIKSLAPTVATIDPLLEPLRRLIRKVEPYEDDVTAGSEGLISATSVGYPEGKTAPGAAALRFVPILTCHRARDPYPEPGEAASHSEPC